MVWIGQPLSTNGHHQSWEPIAAGWWRSKSWLAFGCLGDVMMWGVSLFFKLKKISAIVVQFGEWYYIFCSVRWMVLYFLFSSVNRTKFYCSVQQIVTIFSKRCNYPPGNDHISPIPAGTLESMIFRLSRLVGIWTRSLEEEMAWQTTHLPWVHLPWKTHHTGKLFIFTVLQHHFHTHRIHGTGILPTFTLKINEIHVGEYTYIPCILYGIGPLLTSSMSRPFPQVNDDPRRYVVAEPVSVMATNFGGEVWVDGSVGVGVFAMGTHISFIFRGYKL